MGRQILKHFKSSGVTASNTPQLPSPNDINFGELAINYATDHETLAIKNSSGNIVTFSSDRAHAYEIATSGSSGLMSSEMVTQLNDLVDDEEVIAQAIAIVDHKNIIMPYGAVSGGVNSSTSISNVSLTFTGNLEDTQIINIGSGVTTLNITVNNSGNIATHYVLILNPTSNEVNVSVVEYNLVGTNVVVGETIYETLLPTVTVYHKNDEIICPAGDLNNPGKLQLTLTPYTNDSTFTQDGTMTILVDNGGGSEKGKSTIIIRNWSNS